MDSETIIENISQEDLILLENEIDLERKRISTDRMDISFGELMNMYLNNELIIRPEYQRLFRWNNEQKTAFIESILLGIPIPPIFVAENEDGVWELVDGLQRVSTFISFFGELAIDISLISDEGQEVLEGDDEEEEDMEEIKLQNKWKLGAGNLLPALKGYKVDTFPRKYTINMKRATCRVEILRGESSVSMKYELFKRLNAGGSKLTPQEIRNAIYRSINPKLNEVLLELSQNKIFKKLTNLSRQKKRELYDQELVLRFVAFYNNVSSVNENTEKFLNDFMKKTVESQTFDYEAYKELFIECLGLIDGLEDEKVFKTKSTTNFFVPSEYEGIMIGLAQNIDLYRSNKELLSAKIQELKNDTEFKKSSGTASNSKNRIRNRLSRADEIFRTPIATFDEV